jgi:HAD superfamily hydrolase (TIGR01509 family)
VHGKEWIDYCEKKFDYHKLFCSVTYSFEVGVSKPDPQAFNLILEKLHVTPTECLFIDDSLRNVEAAAKLGINAIQFENSKQLKSELQKLKIKL